MEPLTGAEEQTDADGAADRDHLDLAVGQALVVADITRVLDLAPPVCGSGGPG